MAPPRAPRGEKRVFFATKLLPHVAAAVSKLATEENRSESNMAEELFVRWFREHRPELLAPHTSET